MADDFLTIVSEDGGTFEVLPTDALLRFLQRMAQEKAEERETPRLDHYYHGDE